MKQFLLIALAILYSLNIDAQVLNDIFTCNKSELAAKKYNGELYAAPKDFLHKNLNIHFKKVDLDIGTGRIIIDDQDRGDCFVYDLKRIQSQPTFVKNMQNQQFIMIGFEADAGFGKQVILELFISRDTDKKMNILIKTPLKEYYGEHWYWDIVKK